MPVFDFCIKDIEHGWLNLAVKTEQWSYRFHASYVEPFFGPLHDWIFDLERSIAPATFALEGEPVFAEMRFSEIDQAGLGALRLTEYPDNPEYRSVAGRVIGEIALTGRQVSATLALASKELFSQYTVADIQGRWMMEPRRIELLAEYVSGKTDLDQHVFRDRSE
ncbi:MAG: hypothetical protein AAFX08_11770 [Pseudomonadota bacterium]